jgi:hypothetical protein
MLSLSYDESDLMPNDCHAHRVYLDWIPRRILLLLCTVELCLIPFAFA